MQSVQPWRMTPAEEATALDAVPDERRHGRPKVMFLLSHSGNGGAQELWMNLAEAFRSRGYRVQLAALYKPSNEEPMPAIGSLDWLYVTQGRPSAARMFAMLMLFLRRHDPDFVFTALPAAGVLAPVAALASGGKARIVVSHHTPVDTYAPMLNRLDALTGRLAKVGAIVSVSRAVSDSLEGRSASYRSKTSVIRNSLPPALERHLAELAARRDARPAGRKLLAIGRLAQQKNYPVLLRAMTRVDDAQLTIVGAGPDEQALKGLAQDLGVTDRVRFAGQMSRLEALQMLADSDVFLQPSLFEGHSLALIEASTLGVPLIVSRVPAQVEGVTVSDGAVCGIIVGAEDDEALAAEIRKLLDNEDYRTKWTRRSAALGASTMFAKTVAAYEALVGALEQGRI
jgi:glycosyltransferase involved in cell wall biosynthesis